jgi:hypothetical protein
MMPQCCHRKEMVTNGVVTQDELCLMSTPGDTTDLPQSYD